MRRQAASVAATASSARCSSTCTATTTAKPPAGRSSRRSYTRHPAVARAAAAAQGETSNPAAGAGGRAGAAGVRCRSRSPGTGRPAVAAHQPRVPAQRRAVVRLPVRGVVPGVVGPAGSGPAAPDPRAARRSPGVTGPARRGGLVEQHLVAVDGVRHRERTVRAVRADRRGPAGSCRAPSDPGRARIRPRAGRGRRIRSAPPAGAPRDVAGEHGHAGQHRDRLHDPERLERFTDGSVNTSSEA